MLLQLNSVIVDSDPVYSQEMAEYLGTYGVGVVAQFPDADALPTVLGRANGPHLVIINLDPNASQNLRKVGHLPRQYPGVTFFLLSQTLDAQLLMEAMQMGTIAFCCDSGNCS